MRLANLGVEPVPGNARGTVCGRAKRACRHARIRNEPRRPGHWSKQWSGCLFAGHAVNEKITCCGYDRQRHGIEGGSPPLSRWSALRQLRALRGGFRTSRHRSQRRSSQRPFARGATSARPGGCADRLTDGATVRWGGSGRVQIMRLHRRRPSRGQPAVAPGRGAAPECRPAGTYPAQLNSMASAWPARVLVQFDDQLPQARWQSQADSPSRMAPTTSATRELVGAELIAAARTWTNPPPAFQPGQRQTGAGAGPADRLRIRGPFDGITGIRLE